MNQRNEYLLDHAWQKERERLATIERWVDPWTTQCLQDVGVGTGWRCLEIGAGGGSIAEWLSHRVGPGGHVVATDLETGFLQAIDAPNLEVRRHNVVTDDLEAEAFDLVHARAVLEHLADRDAVLEKMIRAVRSGGYLVVEDGDYISFAPVAGRDAEGFERASRAFLGIFSAAGFDPYFGRQLGHQLRDQGLTDVHLVGQVAEWGGPLPQTKVWSLVFEKLRDGVVAAGLLTSAEAEDFLTLIEAPDFRAMTPILFAAWGRKP